MALVSDFSDRRGLLLLGLAFIRWRFETPVDVDVRPGNFNPTHHESQ